MNEKIQEILKQISETGYKNLEDTTKEYNKLLENSKIVQPEASDEARQAYILNMMLGKAPHPTTIKGFFLGFDGEFDQNKKGRDLALKDGVVNDNGEPIYMNMPKNRNFLEGKPIPSPEDSLTRVCYFVGTVSKEGTEDNWKRATLWNRVKGLVPETMKQMEFKINGAFNKSCPAVGTLDGTQFKVLSDEKINFSEMANDILADNICTFEEIPTFEQPKDFPVMIFKAQVVRTTVTKDEKMNNPVELRMIAETIDDVLKADNIENQTIWCDVDVPLEFGEGDIVWCVGQKYVKQTGDFSLKGFGFFIEKSAFPKNKPAPITEENSKAVEEKVDKPEEWGGEEDGNKPTLATTSQTKLTTTTIPPTEEWRNKSVKKSSNFQKNNGVNHKW